MGTIRHATLTSELNGEKVSAAEWDAAHDLDLEIADITGLQAALDAAGGDPAIADVTGLQAALDAKLASASYTAADVLAKLLTVDGAGSGLDADLLDGQSSAAFALSGHNHDATYAALAHTHTQSDITNLTTDLAAKAAKAQDDEQISGFIASPSDKSYTLALKMAHAGTITETTTKSASGTCTATFKVNSTALGGTANSVSSSEQSQAHASTNTFSAGDDIVLTVSSNSSCADMAFSIKYTRTLD